MLIAEIGNNHFGDIELAKQLIKAAHDSGASISKMQAGVDRGSMPSRFYKQVSFTQGEYILLIDYARSLGSDLFCSVFSPGFDKLRAHQNWEKIAANQYRTNFPDGPQTIASVPLNSYLKPLKAANLMHVTEYMSTDPRLDRISKLNAYYGRQCGYSDHTKGIDNCALAIIDWGARFVEKHFTLEHNMQWEGWVFRDTVHGATPEEFSQLSKIYRDQMKGK